MIRIPPIFPLLTILDPQVSLFSTIRYCFPPYSWFSTILSTSRTTVLVFHRIFGFFSLSLGFSFAIPFTPPNPSPWIPLLLPIPLVTFGSTSLAICCDIAGCWLPTRLLVMCWFEPILVDFWVAKWEFAFWFVPSWRGQLYLWFCVPGRSGWGRRRWSGGGSRKCGVGGEV